LAPSAAAAILPSGTGSRDLYEPDMRIARIRLSDKISRLYVRADVFANDRQSPLGTESFLKTSKAEAV
jgi:hypothetical protein